MVDERKLGHVRSGKRQRPNTTTKKGHPLEHRAAQHYALKSTDINEDPFEGERAQTFKPHALDWAHPAHEQGLGYEDCRGQDVIERKLEFEGRYRRDPFVEKGDG
ncbi:root meristem growth factor [Striga asiatica]|uniref:Root meristem growth factor n=1 Tax=Striga asiatica TaxID=4170 RepID=A0A5A7QUJ6_STRAF|nr:root meristem growth factor [Striga asiatica]